MSRGSRGDRQFLSHEIFMLRAAARHGLRELPLTAALLNLAHQAKRNAQDADHAAIRG